MVRPAGKTLTQGTPGGRVNGDPSDVVSAKGSSRLDRDQLARTTRPSANTKAEPLPIVSATGTGEPEAPSGGAVSMK